MVAVGRREVPAEQGRLPVLAGPGGLLCVADDAILVRDVDDVGRQVGDGGVMAQPLAVLTDALLVGVGRAEQLGDALFSGLLDRKSVV